MSLFRRIQLTVTYPASEGALFTLLDDLVSARGSEIRIIYVEDTNLLRLAELACAREIGSTSARSAGVRRIDLARALQRHAARIESQLSQAFSDRADALYFEVVSGTVASVAMARAQEADVTLLVQAASSLPRARTDDARAEAWTLPARYTPVPPLLLLTRNGNPADRRAIEFAHGLSDRSGHPLRIIQLRPAATSDLPASSADTSPADAGDLAGLVRRLRPWAIVASANAGSAPIRNLARLGDACEVGIFMVN